MHKTHFDIEPLEVNKTDRVFSSCCCFSLRQFASCFCKGWENPTRVLVLFLLFCRMACLQSTWQHRGTTWTASNSFCSTTQRLMTSRWTTSPLCMWRHTAATTAWPKCCWTKEPNPTLGHWSVTDTLTWTHTHSVVLLVFAVMIIVSSSLLLFFTERLHSFAHCL